MDISEVIDYRGDLTLDGIVLRGDERVFVSGIVKSTLLEYVQRVSDERTPSIMLQMVFSNEKWKRYVIEKAWNKTITTVKDWPNHVRYYQTDFLGY